MMAKFGPLDGSEVCSGVSGLDDKLMTHLFLKPVDMLGLLLLLLEPVIVEVVAVAVVLLVAGSLVVIVVVVVSSLLLLFCGRTTFVVSLSMDGVRLFLV